MKGSGIRRDGQSSWADRSQKHSRSYGLRGIGLSVGTRPDCVPRVALDLLCDYRDQGHEVWLKISLQAAVR